VFVLKYQLFCSILIFYFDGVSSVYVDKTFNSAKKKRAPNKNRRNVDKSDPTFYCRSTSSPSVFRCKYCKDFIGSKSEIHHHWIEKHPDKCHVCTKEGCGRLFANKSLLKVHEERKHSYKGRRSDELHYIEENLERWSKEATDWMLLNGFKEGEEVYNL
jgi:hypothetical protein